MYLAESLILHGNFIPAFAADSADCPGLPLTPTTEVMPMIRPIPIMAHL
jgi:hypothetical protein